MKRTTLLSLLLTLLLLLTAGCGSAMPKDSAAETEEAAVEAPAAMEDGGYGYTGDTTPAEQSQSAPEGQSQTADAKSPKLIYTAYMELETTDFDSAAAGLEALVTRLGGYFQNNERFGYDSDYRTASYTVRVPAEHFETLCREAGTLCAQTYLSRSMEDVSEQYADTESRLAAEQTKYNRLLELLAKAEKMEDIISLENALAETEYEIETLTGSLRKYDSLIGYSTVTIELREVYRVNAGGGAPLTFGQRLGEAFHTGLENARDGLEALVLFVVGHFLAILLWAVIIFLVIRFLRARRRKMNLGSKLPKTKKRHFGQKEIVPPAPVEPQSVPSATPPEEVAEEPTPPAKP